MGKKRKFINRRNGNVEYPKNMKAIQKYIWRYLERKMENPNDETLELQRVYLIRILKANGIFHTTYDDCFLQNLGLGTQQVKEKKIKNKQTLIPLPPSDYLLKCIAKYQKLLLLYWSYMNKTRAYVDFLMAFQDYFDPYIDVYGEHLTEQMVLSLTKTLIEPKEEKF